MAIDLLKYMIWKNGIGGGGGGGQYEEKDVGPASILHFEDARKGQMKAYTFEVNPIQDLNGYDNPWPGGGGKNKLDYDSLYANYKTGENSFVGYNNNLDGPVFGAVEIPVGDYVGTQITFSVYMTVTNITAVFPRALINGEYTTTGATQVNNGQSGYATITVTPETENDSISLSYGSGRGSIAFSNLMLEVGSTRTTWEPYSNICPISGWQKATVWNDPMYGGNIEFNQLLPETGETNVGGGVTCTPNGDGSWTLTGNGTGTYRHEILHVSDIDVDDVLYYTTGCDVAGSASTFYVSLRYTPVAMVNGSASSKLFKADNPYDIFSIHTFSKFVPPEGGLVLRPQVFNLTKMFGATVANEILAMEQTEAGTGKAYFKSLFPHDYYPYNPGEHTCVSAVNGTKYGKYEIVFGTVGKNLCNPDARTKYSNTIYEWYKTDGFLLRGGVTYTLSSNGTNAAVYINKLSDGSNIASGHATETVTLTEDTLVYFRMYTTVSPDTVQLQLEEGSSATAFEPYTNIVYGGVCDVVASTITIDRVMTDMGKLNWDKYQSSGKFYSTSINTVCKKGSASVGYDLVMSSAYASANASSLAGLPDMGISVDSGGNVQVYDSRHAASTGTEYKAAVSGIQLLYELATPETYHITPETAVTIYKGENNLWAECGESTGTYVSSNKICEDTVGPTPIVNVSDAVKKLASSLVADMEPSQDLHGYNYPWPDGGGPNVLPISEAQSVTDSGVTFTSNGDGSYTVTGKSTGTPTLKLPLKHSFVFPSSDSYRIVFGNSVASNYVTFKFYDGDTQFNSYRLTPANRVADTFTSGINCDSIGITIQSSGTTFDMTITPMVIRKDADYSSYAPSENICPIVGHTGVTAWRSGVNLLEPKFYSGIGYNKSVGEKLVSTLTDVTNTVTKTGNVYTKTGTSWDIHMSMMLPLSPSFVGETLKFSGEVEQISGWRSAWYITDANYIVKRRAENMNTQPTWELTIQAGDAYIFWYMNSSSAGTYKVTRPQINFGSTALPYEPYVGNTYPVEFPALGNNLAKLEQIAASTNASYKNLTDNSVTVYSTVEAAGYRYKRFKLCDAQPLAGKTVSVSLNATQVSGSSVPRVVARLYESDGATTIGNAFFEVTGTTISRSFTIPDTVADGAMIALNLYCDSGIGGPSETDYTNIILNIGSSALPFEPYDNTVYSGAVDIVSGKLTATHGKIVLNGTQTGIRADWRTSETSTGWLYPWSITKNKVYITDTEPQDVMSDTLQTTTYSSAYRKALDACVTTVSGADGTNIWGIVVRYPNPTLTSTAAVNSYLALHPITVVYELATPQVIQLTPTQVQMLNGQNTVWNSEGYTTLKYYAKKV